jgi:hypothetical protein
MPRSKSSKSVRTQRLRGSVRRAAPRITTEQYMAEIDALVAGAMASNVSSGVVVGHLFVAMERLAHDLAEADGEGLSGPEVFAGWLDLVRSRTSSRSRSRQRVPS